MVLVTKVVVDRNTITPLNVNQIEQELENNAGINNDFDENDSRVINGVIGTGHVDKTNEIVETLSEANSETTQNDPVPARQVKKYRFLSIFPEFC